MPSGYYTVQGGDSYAKLAGQHMGDQRAFGDLARANGYRALHPGDVIRIPTERHKDPFVSSQDVSFAQNSAGPNYKGPVMEQSADYKANYAASVAAGDKHPSGAGIPGLPGFGNGNTNPATGLPNSVLPANRPAPIAGGVNFASGQAAAQQWQANQVPAGGPGGNPRTAAAASASTTAAVAPTMAPTVDPATGQVRVDVQGGQFGQQLSGSHPGLKDIGAASGATPQSAGNKKYEYSGSWASPQAQSKLVTQIGGFQNSTSNPAQQAVKQQNDYVAAQNYVQAIANNQDVPARITNAQLNIIAATSPNILGKMDAIYDVAGNGDLVPRGTVFMPGTQNDPSFVTQGTPTGYSNALPRGYNRQGNAYTPGGRRGSNQGPTVNTTTGIPVQDFSINIGQ